MLSEYVKKLDENGLLLRIRKAVSTKYEISSIIRQVQDKALLFERVSGHDMPILANICATREMVSLGLEISPDELIGKLTNALENPKRFDVHEHSYDEIPVDLSRIPVLTYYMEDGGPYIASAIFVAHDKEYGDNASYHRMMVTGKDTFTARILHRNFNEYLERGLNEFAICIGNPVQVLVASAMSPGIGTSEMGIANSLRETRFVNVDGHAVPEAEIVMIAEPTGRRVDEGPFLDLTETMDIVRKEREFRIKKIYARKGSVFHALLPGGLEHKILMGMPKEPTIFSEVSKVCECRDALVNPGGCSWLHGTVKISKKSKGDGKKAIEAAFRGHKSMKHVVIVDDDIDIHNPSEVEWAIATRVQADRDVIIRPDEKGSSLDPSANPKTRETTKMGIDATIPWGRDRADFTRPPPSIKIDIRDYIGGG
jgi:2,5-furandicarboxylate decarboxylase 1